MLLQSTLIAAAAVSTVCLSEARQPRPLIQASRCRLLQLQQEPEYVLTVSNEADLRRAISNGPDPGVTLLMLSLRGCAKAAKVKRFLVDKCRDNEMMQRVHWECDAEDADTTASALRAVGASTTPFFVAFDTQGEVVMDFVALTPGALFYGLDNLGGVLAAIEEEKAARDVTASGDATSLVSATNLPSADGDRMAALETKVQELQMQLSLQRAELLAAKQTLSSVAELVERVAALEAQASMQHTTTKHVGLGGEMIEREAEPSTANDALSSFLAAVPDEGDEVADPFAFVLGDSNLGAP